MSTLVTCMGESLIDFVPLNAAGQGEGVLGPEGGKPEDQGEVLLKGAMRTDFRMYPGGSIFNVAVGLARLGQHVAFAGKIAEDFFGHHLLRTLKIEGVDIRFVTTAKAQSTLAFVSAVAALNCAQAGANPPRRSEVEQFIAQLAL